MIFSPLPCWSSPPPVTPDPNSGAYLLPDGTRISTTFRGLIEDISPAFARLRCVPLVRQATLRYLRSISMPGHEHRDPWRPDHRFAAVRPFLDQLLQPHHWAHLQVLCAPITLHTTRPLAAGSLDALVRHRLTRQTAILSIETAPRAMARAASSAVLAHQGAFVAAAADAFRAAIDHVIIVWATPEAPPQFELFSPDRCLENWTTAVDLNRWMAHNRMLPHQQCPPATSTASPSETFSSASKPQTPQA